MSRDSDQEHQNASRRTRVRSDLLFPTCSGALVAALVLLLAGFGDPGLDFSPPGYLSVLKVAPLVAALLLLVAGLILLVTGLVLLVDALVLLVTGLVLLVAVLSALVAGLLLL